MKPRERQVEIVSRLRALQRELTVEELAEFFSTSSLTIRRDLDTLIQEGFILRTHGGCLLRSGPEAAFQKRLADNYELKAAIGRAAAGEVRSGQVILIDDGSTTYHLASNLEGKEGLIVYTNSLAFIPQVSHFPSVRLCILGGEYHPDRKFLGGSIAEWVLDMLEFDIVFVGVDAVDDSGRCLAIDPVVARLTQLMLKRARRKILLADHTKAGARSYAAYGSLRDFDLWITTPGLKARYLSHFREMTKIIEAPLGGTKSASNRDSRLS
jgi:DeoR/GlpR family transcriptional regulator of sugar metabolism